MRNAARQRQNAVGARQRTTWMQVRAPTFVFAARHQRHSSSWRRAASPSISTLAQNRRQPSAESSAGSCAACGIAQTGTMFRVVATRCPPHQFTQNSCLGVVTEPESTTAPQCGTSAEPGCKQLYSIGQRRLYI
ncbi:uncharacterized protein [Dermacentor andersoni]|uniref:uncharacterized protein isoform X3 n=1 Tax=Dermacentor andersoni TaxID=34620 RepID=UPI00241702E1|nr:uncharacterized protein LOC126539601 isoform X3 [Dermacentor andersoni]